MREFTQHIKEHLTTGLRREPRADRNIAGLSEAFNVRIEKTGLEAAPVIEDPFVGTEAVSFPFPQIHVGEKETLLLRETSIHRVDRSGSPWVPSLVTVTAIDGEAGNSIPSGGPWHAVDLKTAWYLFNGQCSLAIVDPIEGDSALLDRTTGIQTGTHFRGRVVVGGADPDEIFGRGWGSILEFWERKDWQLPEFEPDDVGSNYVMWGSIGGGDFPLWLFQPELLHRGPVEQLSRTGSHRLPPQDTYVMDKIEQGQFGFMPMPFDGSVLAVKTLGNGVMVYGDEGIAYMPHVAQAEPAPTFGLRKVSVVGIAGRGAVGGSENFHVFVDTRGAVWSISSELQLNRLGYSEWVSPMLSNEIVISHNEERNDFYISNSSKCFLLTRAGMSELNQRPTSVFYLDGDLIGLFEEGEEDEDDDLRIVSNVFDMGFTSMKTVTGASLGISSSATVDIAFDYRYRRGEAFSRTKFVRINREGDVVLRITGTEFRVVVRADDFSDVELDYITVRWQSSDKRTVRGPVGTATTA